MSDRSTSTGEVLGPDGYENWRRHDRGEPPRYGHEWQLYSDARVVNEITDGCGPYRVWNTVSMAHQSLCPAVAVLRAFYHGDGYRSPDMERTDTTRYHGGGLAQEIAAVIGLSLGIRMQAGDATRDIDFYPPAERPRAEDPTLIPVRIVQPGRRPVLPGMTRQVEITPATLAGYTNLPPASAVALVRAARLYQRGLWMCESNPSDAWLMLVSAVEVAAVRWRSAEHDDDPETLFRTLKPEWASRLDQSKGASLVRDMAVKWTDLLSATNRFLKFLKHHMPPAPEERPNGNFARVDWEVRGMTRALAKVYDHRSKALHGGTPFPAPMCQAPAATTGEGQTVDERPWYIASASQGGVWLNEDCPMYLHTFAYIARGAILKWWHEMSSTSDVASV